MVCTYQRPEQLPRFLESVSGISVPDGIEFHVVVADNNPVSALETYIGPALSKLPFEYSYGHEPRGGYVRARNKALELALKTNADLYAFSDDDMELDPDWLEGHLKSHAEFGCDVVGGAIRGRMSGHAHGRRFAHGEHCKTQGTGNVSFLSRLIDPDGLALRFDMAFNKTGREDQAFFREAHAKGATIVFSKYPIVHDPSMMGEAWIEELENKAAISALMLRNDIVKIRKERGLLPAIGTAIWSLRFAVKAAISSIDHIASRLSGQRKRADRKRISAIKNKAKATQAFKGLAGDYVARNSARRR